MQSDKSTNGRNYLNPGESTLRGAIIPDIDGMYDLGSPDHRLGTVYSVNSVGSISDPDVEINTVRWPYTAPFDIRMRRTGAKTLELDDNAGGGVTFNVVGVITKNGVPIADVYGPASSTDNAIARFDGTTGKLIQNSLVIIDDSGNLTASKLISSLTTGEAIKLGATTNSSSPDPVSINMGGTYSDTAGSAAKLKIKLWSDGTSHAGIGHASATNYHYINTGGKHDFYVATAIPLSVTASGITTPQVATASGDLTLTPAGSNINANNKNFTNIATANMANAVVSTKQTTQAITYPPANTTYSLSGKNLYDINVMTNYLGAWSPSNYESFSGSAANFSGQYMMYARSSAGVFLSKDFGANFTLVTSGRKSAAVCCDPTGALIYHGAFNTAGQTGIYQSVDYGTTWTQMDSTDRYYNQLCCSADGKKVVGITTNVGLYISNNYGNAMTATDGVKNWSWVCMSRDGMKIFASVNSATVACRLSNDGGVTWQDSFTGLYTRCAMSGDGKVIVLMGSNLPLRISRDGGQTFDIYPDETRNFTACAVNFDGSYIVTCYGLRLRMSKDFGYTWLDRPDGTNLLNGIITISVSGNGRYSVAGEHTALWRGVSTAVAETNYADCEIAGMLTVGNKAYINNVVAQSTKSTSLEANSSFTERAIVTKGTTYYLDSFDVATPSIRSASGATGGTINFNGATLSNCTISANTPTVTTIDFTYNIKGPISLIYRKQDSFCDVEVSGTLNMSQNASAISATQLPVAYRPTTSAMASIHYYTTEGGAAVRVGRISINSSGYITLEVVNSSLVAGFDYIFYKLSLRYYVA